MIYPHITRSHAGRSVCRSGYLSLQIDHGVRSISLLANRRGHAYGRFRVFSGGAGLNVSSGNQLVSLVPGRFRDFLLLRVDKRLATANTCENKGYEYSTSFCPFCWWSYNLPAAKVAPKSKWKARLYVDVGFLLNMLG